ncbi:MAG TPA: HEAT repeat domain-containing protein [Cyclobacteriaceae bacterium]
MDKEKLEQTWIEYLSNELTGDKKAEFEYYLIQNPEWKKALEEDSKIWKAIDSIPCPEPSFSMDRMFYESLQKEIRKEKKFSVDLSWLTSWLQKSKLVLGGFALTIGMLIGIFLSNYIAQPKYDKLSNEVHEIKKMMMLTLLDQSSATQRIKAVNISEELPRTDDIVIEALLNTLNSDPNVNVRLEAVDALRKVAHDPKARIGMIRSINKQTSPLVQIEMANVMLEINEGQAVEAFKTLIKSKDLNETVKDKLNFTIEKLS